MSKIRVTAHIAVDEAELAETFIRASGPGGQNVNKVASAVQLRFDAARSPSLPDDVRRRLMVLAGRRLTKDGVLVLEGSRFRAQKRNRADVRERLFELIRRAAVAPKTRKPTRRTKAGIRHRLERKKARAAVKRQRRKPVDD